MKHLNNFERFNESTNSRDSEMKLLEKIIEKLSTNSEKFLKFFLPYKETLVNRLKKYYIDGVIRADLIESDIKNLKLMRMTNEDYDSKSKFQRVLSFILGIPVEMARSIWEGLLDTIDDIKSGNYLFAIVRVFISSIVAIIVLAISLVVIDSVKYSIYGLERGVVTSEVQYVPKVVRGRTVKVGYVGYHRPTAVSTPEHWTVTVKGIGSDSTRTETWYTYDKDVAQGISVGDTLTNNNDWSYDFGTGR